MSLRQFTERLELYCSSFYILILDKVSFENQLGFVENEACLQDTELRNSYRLGSRAAQRDLPISSPPTPVAP